MQSHTQEVLEKLKELRNLSHETERNLEAHGLSITNISKEQLFNHNIKNIITSMEVLIRNEPSEGAILRLEKELPDIHRNIGKVKQTPSGQANAANLDRIASIIRYIEQVYGKL